MYLLLSGCENPDVLSVIYFIEKILNVVFIIIPIGLILFITIDLVKTVLNGNNEKNVKDNNKIIVKRLILAIAIFFVPTIITLLTNLMSNAGIEFATEYKKCMNVTKERIDEARKKQEEEDKKWQEEVNSNKQFSEVSGERRK